MPATKSETLFNSFSYTSFLTASVWTWLGSTAPARLLSITAKAVSCSGGIAGYASENMSIVAGGYCNRIVSVLKLPGHEKAYLLHDITQKVVKGTWCCRLATFCSDRLRSPAVELTVHQVCIVEHHPFTNTLQMSSLSGTFETHTPFITARDGVGSHNSNEAANKEENTIYRSHVV